MNIQYKDAIIFILQLNSISKFNILFDYDYNSFFSKFRSALFIRPLHPECRIQLIDSLLQLELLFTNQSHLCKISSVNVINIVMETDNILFRLIQQENERLHKISLFQNHKNSFDYLGIAITYQRISNLLLSQVFNIFVFLLIFIHYLIDYFLLFFFLIYSPIHPTKYPQLSIELLEKSLQYYLKDHEIYLQMRSLKNNSTHEIQNLQSKQITQQQQQQQHQEKIFYHSSYLKGLVQRVLQYVDLKQYNNALNGINEMEKITSNTPTIDKLRNYLENKIK